MMPRSLVVGRATITVNVLASMKDSMDGWIGWVSERGNEGTREDTGKTSLP